MDSIKFRNNPDPYIYLFIVLLSATNVIFQLLSIPTLFYTSCALTILYCIFLYVRSIEIWLDKRNIKIKFKALLTYKTIDLSFDLIKISGSLDDTITFYKNNVEVLRLRYEDHIEEPTYKIGEIQIHYKQKMFEIGNKKTSFDLFEKIKLMSSKHITTAHL